MKTPTIDTPQNMEEINSWIEQLPTDHSIIASTTMIKLLKYFNHVLIPRMFENKIERIN